MKLNRKQDLNVLYQVCVFGPIGNTRRLPWPLIGWNISDFSSESAERNSSKLSRKQDLNVLYQVCVFRADRKNKMATVASDWLIHFRLLLWTEFNETWQEARSQRALPSLYFRADPKNKIAALASDLLRHFRLLLWNQPTEFNENWQEARSQRPLPSLCFSSWSEIDDGRPGLWLAEAFSTSLSETAEQNSSKFDRKKDLNVLSHVRVLGPIGKTRWPPWPLIGWYIFTSPQQPPNGIQWNLTRSKIQTSSTRLVISGRSEKQDGHPVRSVNKGGTLYTWARYLALLTPCLKFHLNDKPDKIKRKALIGSCELEVIKYGSYSIKIR